MDTDQPMHTISVRPLTVNQAWKGRRFRTDAYKRYEKEVYYLLPRGIDVPEGPCFLLLVFGLSSACSDWDNPVKPFQDILQKRYGFNDRQVVAATVAKDNVSTGQEYVGFRFISLKQALNGQVLEAFLRPYLSAHIDSL